MSRRSSRQRRVRVDAPQHRSAPAPPPEPVADTIECACPRIELDDWHEVESDWSDIQFLQSGVTAVAGVPVGFAGVREKLQVRAESSGLTVPESAMLLLGEGRVRRSVMLEVESAADVAGVVRPGGIAWSRVAPAHFGAMKRLAAETREMAKGRYGRKPDALWVWYLTCAVCSEARDWETMFIAHYRAV